MQLLMFCTDDSAKAKQDLQDYIQEIHEAEECIANNKDFFINETMTRYRYVKKEGKINT